MIAAARAIRWHVVPSTLAFVCSVPFLEARAQGVLINIAPQGCPHPTAVDMAPLPLPPTPHLGIALGSGSMHGIAHIGVLQELEAQRVEVKVVAGTSVGALVGALWASGLPAASIERLHRQEAWDDVGTFTLSRGGVFDNERLGRRLQGLLAGKPMESWPRRFGAVATDLGTGDRVLLSRGDGARAVQASTAMAAFFVPVEIGGRRLADGALVEPVPVHAARELGASFVIAIDVAYRPHEGEAATVTQVAFQAMHILTNALALEQLKRADVAVRIDLHETFTKCGPNSLVAAGRQAMREAWPRVVRQLERAASR
jgi:NTE family protein